MTIFTLNNTMIVIMGLCTLGICLLPIFSKTPLIIKHKNPPKKEITWRVYGIIILSMVGIIATIVKEIVSNGEKEGSIKLAIKQRHDDSINFKSSITDLKTAINAKGGVYNPTTKQIEPKFAFLSTHGLMPLILESSSIHMAIKIPIFNEGNARAENVKIKSWIYGKGNLQLHNPINGMISEIDNGLGINVGLYQEVSADFFNKSDNDTIFLAVKFTCSCNSKLNPKSPSSIISLI